MNIPKWDFHWQGNYAFANSVMATAGVFVGGGIVVKMLPKMASGSFLRAFRDKGRYRDLLSQIPVGVLLNPKTALIGAAHSAVELLR